MLISFERHVKYQSKQPICHSITGNEHSIRVNLAAKMKKVQREQQAGVVSSRE